MIHMGINISDKEYPFTEEIFHYLKDIETRNTPTLRPYIGRRVGIIRTGKGKAQLVGWATISEEVTYTTAAQFQADVHRHQITSGRTQYQFNGIKYGYVLTDVTPCEPVPINTRGIVSRKIA